MKVYSDIELDEFIPWSGATYTMEELTDDEIKTLEQHLEDVFPDGISSTQLNDILWFDTDYIAEILGYEDWEDLEAKHKEAKEDEC